MESKHELELISSDRMDSYSPELLKLDTIHQFELRTQTSEKVSLDIFHPFVSSLHWTSLEIKHFIASNDVESIQC